MLKAAALASAPTGLLGGLDATRPAVAAAIEGSYSMAMHVHSSFSELYGSMNAHLFQARARNVDVIWWTEHDTKMNGVHDRQVVHFTSLTNETTDGPPWQWAPIRRGRLTAASGGGIVSSPASPLDPIPQGSMRVTAQSADAATASFGFQPGRAPGQQNWRTNLTDQTLRIEVLPTAVGPDSYLELRIASSYHPPSGGRDAGMYTLSYRAGGAGPPGRRSVGTTAIVTVNTIPGVWNSLELRPSQDLLALFPDLDSRDFSLFQLTLSAVSTGGATASGCFDYLRFSRRTTGEVALQVQGDMMTTSQARYPGVVQRRGLEVSHWAPHVNWFGGSVSIPDFTGVTPTTVRDYLRSTIVPQIHRSGGLASYNHPYGTTFLPPLPVATQKSMRAQVAAEMLADRALGADILEVGYPVRAGVELARHVELWDVCSRNALFLTGNGVSDDHAGVDWAPRGLDWVTSVWAPSRTEGALLRALRAGRAWCGSLLQFPGGLDLLVDGSCPMGSASVSAVRTRNLRARALGLPPNSRLEVVQGVVDYAGPGSPVPTSQVVASVPESVLGSGGTSLEVDTSRSSFVRTQVRSSAGDVIALSNPAWLLREVPPAGIPPARRAA